ncbi:MAG: hypothetical protein Kow0063_02450 [Anaerolineae bacterium]
MLSQQPADSLPSHPPRLEEDIFPAFPAPRVWYLGWEGDAWAGIAHADSTADFMPGIQNNTNIAIIRQSDSH